MAPTYGEISKNRNGRVSRAVKARRKTFEQSYDLGLQLITLREQRGLTQAGLAMRSGMDQGDVSRIERGATSPTVLTLQRIGDALDADVRLVARAS